jgi:signal peptidase II
VLRRPAATFASLLAIIVALDQVSKYLVRTTMAPPGTSVPLLGHWLRLTYVLNPGAAFGLLPGHGFVFMGVSVLVLAGIGVYLVRVRPTRALLVVALGMVAAGAVGNLIDRATAGLVTDFIQVPFDFPVFNLADSSIFIGVAMLVWWVLFGPAEHGAATGADAHAPSEAAQDTTPAEGA